MARRRSLLPLVLPPRGVAFPNPRAADDEGLVGVGGSLSSARLMAGYRLGIFPWYSGGSPILWWCPNPRATLDEEHLHVSRRLARTLRSGRFQISCDRAFEAVIHACATNRPEGTWILPEMIDAFTQLAREGRAHSFEAWRGGQLVGGLYGVAVGRAFAAESMFFLERDASKVCLVTAARWLFEAGLTLFDVQFLTDHLASLGVRETPRDVYLDRLSQAQAGELDWDEIRARGASLEAPDDPQRSE
ncbi:MAG: leucyl/phenylalanyl-tRNA--protein transferase [Polyangiaceae bacterium]|nr:leucyl/phenylalanyl-tRNA--protein transferase [Polyangiaceae bacterium]MCW5789476.1 leucyl/phenylalanyl-tRNA--protein transferase [Polyangiaceae bacterium]